VQITRAGVDAAVLVCYRVMSPIESGQMLCTSLACTAASPALSCISSEFSKWAQSETAT
jgi:hypothetical protein